MSVSMTNHRMNSGSVLADHDELRACRELLRHLNHPRRLRDNVMVRRMLSAKYGDAIPLTDAALVATVGALIESSIETLPTRQQIIVRRCNLGGERYADVARSLFISERHAFRERNAAVQNILAHLRSQRRARIETAAVADTFALHVAHARTLEQNGNWATAVEVLKRLRSDAVDDDARCYVETKLVRVYDQAERFADANDHLNAALVLATAAGKSSWHSAEVGVAAARLAAATGDSRGADQLARRSCSALESWAHGSTRPRIRDALVDGLVLRAELAIGLGELDASASLASRARELVAHAPSIDPQTAIAASTTWAAVEFLRVGDGRSSEQELLRCYALAAHTGLTRQAIVVATHLSGCMRLTGRVSDAARFLTPLVPTARIISRGSAAAFFCELVSSYIESRNLKGASLYLAELRRDGLRNPLAQASADFVAAKTQLALRDYASALEAAERAESSFRRLAQDRVVGTSLRLQAEALAALGQRKRALAAIKSAIEILAGRSHPARLAAAYRILAALSGKVSYAATARRLLKQIGRG